jgi:hypothetical protein
VTASAIDRRSNFSLKSAPISPKNRSTYNGNRQHRTEARKTDTEVRQSPKANQKHNRHKGNLNRMEARANEHGGSGRARSPAC